MSRNEITSEAQPLLDPSVEEKEVSQNSWYRRLPFVSADNSHTRPSLVNLFELFRFTNRVDRLLLIVGLFATIIDGCSYVAYIVLFGQLTGAFTQQSYNDRCQNGSRHSVVSLKCPLGIEINSVNRLSLQKFCHEDTYATTKFHDEVMNRIVWIFVVGIISFFGETLEYYLFDLVAQRQTSRIRALIFQTILQRKMSYFDSHPIGNINQNLLANIEKFQTGLGYRLALVISAIVTSVVGITVAFVVSWRLASILLLILPFILIATSIFSKITSRETLRELEAYATTNRIVQEVFSCIRTVLSLNGSEYEQKRSRVYLYENALSSTTSSSIRKGAVYGLFVGWVSFQLDLIYAIGFMAGSLLLNMQGRVQLSISDVIIVVTTFAQSLYFISSNGPFFQAFLEARTAASVIFSLIDDIEKHEKELDLDENHRSIQLDGMIQFDSVNFEYPTRPNVPVLRDANFALGKGEKIALIGSSGCGKTSCISLLLRYYDPTSGRILINEQSIARFNVQQIRENMATVSQEPILFDTTIYDNIRYGKLNANRAEIEQAAQQANAHHFIQRLPDAYDTLVGERGIQLSGGEKQRIALARALVKQSHILLLDEPASALDAVNERILQEALDRTYQGRITLVVTHRLETIRDAHRIYVLEKGSVIEQGTHETLMSQENSRYRQMIAWQQKQRSIQDSNPTIEVKANGNILSRVEELPDNVVHQEQHHGETFKESPHQSSSSLFKRLLIMNSPDWHVILVGCLACVASGLIQPLHAFLLMKIIDGFDECTYQQERKQVLSFGLLLIILGLAAFIVRFGQFTAFAISGSKLSQHLSLKVFNSLHGQEVAYFDQPENTSGAISSRLSRDALAVQQMVGIRIGIICETLSMFLFGVTFGFFVNTSLTVICCLCLLFVLLLALIEIRFQIKLNQRSEPILERANALSIRYRHLVISAVLFGVYWTTSIYTLGILYWRTLILFERNEIQLKETLIVFAVATYFLRSLQVVLTMIGEISASLSAARTFFDVIDREPSIDNGSTSGKCLENFQGKIRFDHVCFAYPSRPESLVLHRFTLNIKPGQRIAIIGTSGSGKSTVVQLIERFYDVTQGCLYVDDVDIRQLNIRWFRSCLAYVGQEPVLFDMTIAENISYGLTNVTMDDIIDAANQANIHSFIEQLPQGYQTNVSEKGRHLSGGQKQRIAIARALIRRPKILLLDEVTSALDSTNEQAIEEIFSARQDYHCQRTTIIITHRLSTIQSCDLICVLDQRNIIEFGRHEDLIQQRGFYYQNFFPNLHQ